MLDVLHDFRKKLDDVMTNHLHKSIILIGYENYTGRFIKWYAKYYHNLSIAYLVDDTQPRGVGHEFRKYTRDLFMFQYQNIDPNSTVIWVAEPVTDNLRDFLRDQGYVENNTWFDFRRIIYGEDLVWDEQEVDVFHKRKSGPRDVQFLEYLEWKYGCNFVTRIPLEQCGMNDIHGAGFGATTQKEIFPILDQCHCIPKADDAIFDFGCGKGASLMAFLDYGFERVGGVEYNPQIFSVLEHNMKLCGIDEKLAEIILADAASINDKLDDYNWFYHWQSFDDVIFKACVEHLCESYRRKERKMHFVDINPHCHKMIEGTGVFRLKFQMEIDTRNRVVDVFESV